MTEIPEHLLKRSKERRAALGLGGDAPADAPADTPATTAAAAPVAAAPAAPAPRAAPAAPPPPKPDPHYVAASKRRRRIPFWAMTALSILPLWAFMYVRSLTPVEHAAAGPVGAGQAVWASCTSCHGANGEGQVGRQLNDGEVLLTFPHIQDQLNLVSTGSQAYLLAGLPGYGDLARPGGPHLGYNGAYMPPFGTSLSEVEILEVVCYVRYGLPGNADPAGELAEEYERWCSEESEVFAGLQDGSLTFDSPELGVGTEPRPATAAGE